MDLTNILQLLGGLALFLHGMQLMSSGLEAAAGDRMRDILERLTANRFLAVGLGALITVAVQSSSATTIMVLGFVNSGMMTLNQAVWIIMGANVGTTVTGLLIALDVGMLAPLFAFVGIALMVFLKKPRTNHIGSILAGLGIIFIGMTMMSTAMEPLREMPAFLDLIATFSNPLVGILVGALFTALIQSSAASVGILQALARSGVIGLSSASYVLFGQNIGTCITAVLASAGTNRNAKRTTLIHLFFNLFGALLFTLLCLFTPLVSWVESLVAAPAGQIAAMHILFNIGTTLLLLPAGSFLVKLTLRILPEHASEIQEQMHLEYLTPLRLRTDRTIAIGSSAIYLSQLHQELSRMLSMARDNIDRSFRAAMEPDPQLLSDVRSTEEYLDFLNREISQYVSRTIAFEKNQKDSAALSACFKMAGNIERLGDHAMNIADYSAILHDRGIRFSAQAQDELAQMREICLRALGLLADQKDDPALLLQQVEALEDKIDEMTESFRLAQLGRMKDRSCDDQACILFSELLTDFERIGDHSLNIAQAKAGITEA